MPKMIVHSALKKYKDIEGYIAMAHSVNSLVKHLSMKFKISEFELHKAIKSNKILIFME